MISTDLKTVRSGADLASLRSLFREYGEALRDEPTSEPYFSFADFEAEMLTLPAPYTELLLAQADETPAGCVAYRVQAAQQSCEIKRLYVRPAFRGNGLARQLVHEVMARAAKQGCNRVILDTIMVDAEALYRSMGFWEYKPRDGLLTFMQCELPPAPQQPAPEAASASR